MKRQEKALQRDNTHKRDIWDTYKNYQTRNLK